MGMDRRSFLAGAAGLALSGGLAPAARARRRAVALVTADAESHVAVVDPVSGRVLRRIPTAALPRSIETVGAVAVVAHTELGRLSLVDGPGRGLRSVTGILGEPRYTAAHPDGRHAYVSDSGRGQIAVLDVDRGRVMRRLDVGGPARHLSLSPDGRRLWTALGTAAAEIAVVDTGETARPRMIRRMRAAFPAHDVVFAPSGARIWVSSGSIGRVAIHDADTGRVVRSLSAGAAPQHIAFSPSGLAVYVTSGDDGSLRVHRPDGRVLREAAIPLGSFNVTRGSGLVLSPSLTRGTLCVLDGNGRVRRTIAVASAAHDACVI